MRYKVYILYSAILEKYYVGHTGMEIAERLERHLHDHGGYTSKVKDWECIWVEEFLEKTDAIIKEKEIKKRGAGRYIADRSGA